MKKGRITYLLLSGILLGLTIFFFLKDRGKVFLSDLAVSAQSTGQSESKVSSEPEILIAAPGRVEPISEEIKVGTEISGKLKEILVEEGDRVQAGQVIAVLENSDYRARVASAEARLRQAEAELRRILNGARHQERLQAQAGVEEAEAVLENARIEMKRRQSLYRDGFISREEVDRSEREYQVAKARYEASLQHQALINAAAREEDRSKAQADVALARAQLDEARARLEKTMIRSPLTGVVLRKYLKTGESVISDAPHMPIITVADTTILRVRVDVDETDVGKIRIGQRAYVTADAYAGKKFFGRVVRIGQILGKKNIRTDEPSERVDTKILETLVELDPGTELPLGLRVNTFILADTAKPPHQATTKN
jgi:HlyD family secretion protein